MVVISDGVPGVTLGILPRWRADVPLALSGVAHVELGAGARRASRAAAFLTVQPLVGALLGAALIVGDLWMSAAAWP